MLVVTARGTVRLPADELANAAALEGRLAGLAGRLEVVAPGEDAALAAILAECGFHTEGEVWQMERRLTGDEPAPAWPAGVRVREYDDALDARPLHALLERAFAANAESVPAFADWHREMTGDPEFDPSVWWLAECSGAPVGAALCWPSGWLKDLAVDPAERGRGVGSALCRHAFRELGRRGVGTVGLKVDAGNPTGAVRLYERLGLRVVRVFRLYVRES